MSMFFYDLYKNSAMLLNLHGLRESYEIRKKEKKKKMHMPIIYLIFIPHLHYKLHRSFRVIIAKN